jgi:hypothetical protein
MFFSTRCTSCLMHIVIDGAYNNMVGHRAYTLHGQISKIGFNWGHLSVNKTIRTAWQFPHLKDMYFCEDMELFHMYSFFKGERA